MLAVRVQVHVPWVHGRGLPGGALPFTSIAITTMDRLPSAAAAATLAPAAAVALATPLTLRFPRCLRRRGIGDGWCVSRLLPGRWQHHSVGASTCLLGGLQRGNNSSNNSSNGAYRVQGRGLQCPRGLPWLIGGLLRAALATTAAALAVTLATAALATAALDALAAADGAFHSSLGSCLGGRKLAEQVRAGVHDPGAHRRAVGYSALAEGPRHGVDLLLFDPLLAVGIKEQPLSSTACEGGG